MNSPPEIRSAPNDHRRSWAAGRPPGGAQGGPRPSRRARGSRPRPFLRARRLLGHAGPHRPRPARRGPGHAHAGRVPLRRPRDPARDPALQGPARHPRHRAQPERRGSGGDGRDGGRAPGDARSSRRTPLDAPFIFESLKNYFRKAGLRVFSAIHPIFTVRRQWERIVWMGGPHEDGAKELLLQLPDRARRVQGAPAAHRARGLLRPQVACSPPSRTTRR